MNSVVARRRIGFTLLGLVIVGAVWELYKNLAPAQGVSLFGTRLLPRTTDAAMPQLSSIWHAFGQTEVNANVITTGAGKSVLTSVLQSGLHSIGWAGMGFVIGVIVGLILAVAMDALRIVERAILPYVILSQTVPLIALAPLVTGWSDGSRVGFFTWHTWMSAALIAAYLAFFPVAVGMARGLKSASAVHREYFRSASAGYWSTLRKLKIPAAIPFLIPALRLAAAGAVVGTVVAEISIGLEGGIGRLIISYSVGATGDPSRVYTAVIGAAVLGLIAAGLISLLDLALRRFTRSGEFA